eukprot:6026738-Amphidinium_carterae.1
MEFNVGLLQHQHATSDQHAKRMETIRAILLITQLLLAVGLANSPKSAATLFGWLDFSSTSMVM